MFSFAIAYVSCSVTILWSLKEQKNYWFLWLIEGSFEAFGMRWNIGYLNGMENIVWRLSFLLLQGSVLFFKPQGSWLINFIVILTYHQVFSLRWFNFFSTQAKVSKWDVSLSMVHWKIKYMIGWHVSGWIIVIKHHSAVNTMLYLYFLVSPCVRSHIIISCLFAALPICWTLTMSQLSCNYVWWPVWLCI